MIYSFSLQMSLRFRLCASRVSQADVGEDAESPGHWLGVRPIVNNFPTMKTTLLILLFAALGIHAAEVPLPPFTNAVGVVVSNAVAVKALQSGLQYSIPNGGGVIPWAKVAPEIKEKFPEPEPVTPRPARTLAVSTKKESTDYGLGPDFNKTMADAEAQSEKIRNQLPKIASQVQLQRIEANASYIQWSYRVKVTNAGTPALAPGKIYVKDRDGFELHNRSLEKVTVPTGASYLTGTFMIKPPAGNNVASATIQLDF